MARADGKGPGLAELQREFFELVTGREGVARELTARGLPEAHVAESLCITGDARASAVERLDVYANMYFFRILDVLHADYPKVRRALGDDAFHNLATDYLAAHPSRHPSLRFVGAALPGFVAARGGDAWLAELAALEWARVDVFDRADAPVLARETLAAMAPEAFADARLTTIPAFELVPAAWAVEEPWRWIEEHGGDDAEATVAAPARAPAGHALVVWRRGTTVHHRSAKAREAAALSLGREGTTFGALCSVLGESSSEEEAAALAVAFLGWWLADELLAGEAGPAPA